MSKLSIRSRKFLNNYNVNYHYIMYGSPYAYHSDSNDSKFSFSNKRTKEVCIFFLNIIHMTINEPDSNINDYYLLSSLYRVLICVTCREIFRTLLTQERLFELLTAVYIVYIITILQSLRT